MIPTTETLSTAAILDAARACVGTPFAHMGRTPGIGLDCIGLVVEASRAIHYPVADLPTYTHRPTPERILERRLAETFDFVGETLDEAIPGDVLAFAGGRRTRWASHVGLLDEAGWLLHAHLTVGRVVRARLDGRWQRRLHSVWRWRDG